MLFREREAAQEKILDQGKDGGIGADPEREGENRDRAEAGRLQQHAQGVTQVSDHDYFLWRPGYS